MQGTGGVDVTRAGGGGVPLQLGDRGGNLRSISGWNSWLEFCGQVLFQVELGSLAN